MSLDAVVARVGAALGRGHALFSPGVADASSAAFSSADTFDGLARRVSGSTQMLDARGAFGNTYQDLTQRFSDRFTAAGGQDRLLAGHLGDAFGADSQGRTQSGAIVNAAGADTAAGAPYANTAAGQNSLLRALRDRVDDQLNVIDAYKRKDAQLAAMVRRLQYRSRGGSPAGGLGQMFGGLGGGRQGSGGGGLGGFTPPNLSSLAHLGHDTNSTTPIGAFGVPDDPDSGLGAPAARAALSKLGHAYVLGAKGPNVFDCSGLVQWAWGQVGVHLGPNTYSQINEGIPIPAGQQRAGDMIFPLKYFGENNVPGPGHVMLAISRDQCVHAPQTGDVVRIAPMPSAFVVRRPR